MFNKLKILTCAARKWSVPISSFLTHVDFKPRRKNLKISIASPRTHRSKSVSLCATETPMIDWSLHWTYQGCKKSKRQYIAHSISRSKTHGFLLHNHIFNAIIEKSYYNIKSTKRNNVIRLRTFGEQIWLFKTEVSPPIEALNDAVENNYGCSQYPLFGSKQTKT